MRLLRFSCFAFLVARKPVSAVDVARAKSLPPLFEYEKAQLNSNIFFKTTMKMQIKFLEVFRSVNPSLEMHHGLAMKPGAH
jgi:hypothetical protein